MKFKITFFIFLCLHNIPITTNPTLVAVLMVKNEAPVMQKTLQPLVDAGITDYLIYDTGSTDETIAITQDFFTQHNIDNYVIEQGAWVDFATSRNQALQLAQQHFAQATFMLMLDAEWILHNGADLLNFCLSQKEKSETLYHIRIIGPNLDFYHARLIRTKSDIDFVGKVHEVPNIPAQAKVPSNIYFQLNPTDHGKNKSQDRWLRDLKLLLEEFQNNPNNSRTVYYIAQTYFCLQDLPNAIKWYEYRATLDGDDEENFLTLLVLAQTYYLAGNFDKMIINYLKAFALRPHRADPLIRLAQYYYSVNEFYLCYVFAKYAISMPYPEQENAPVEKWLYDFVRYDLISATAYMMGEFKLGQQATLQALKAYPDLDYLHKNLKDYEEKLRI